MIIPHVPSIVGATHVRSTLLQSSLAYLKARGHYERYLRALDPQHLDVITNTLAPVWLPIEVGMAHYAACDALGLDDVERAAIGRAVGDKIHGTLMQTVVKSARAAGVTPWVLLGRFDRFWGRVFQGGSVELIKVGPKDLAINVCRARLPQYEYFRIGVLGVVHASFKFVGVRAAYVKQSSWHAAQDRFVITAAWV